MDYIKQNAWGIIAVIGVILLAFFGTTKVITNLGGSAPLPPTTITNPFRFAQGAIFGGGITATSTTSDVVILVATDFDTENVIDVTLNISDATLSFPATTTLSKDFLPMAGDTRTLFIRNATTTAAMDLTLSGGTGFLYKQASSTTAVIAGDADGGNFARLDLIRKANTDIEILSQVYTDPAP